jgi:hypothetical protein
MYGKDVKVGMKVVPVIKTIEGPLSNSKEWAAAGDKGQKFLYVIRLMSPAGKGFVCAVDKNAKSGDKFSAIDLRSMDWAGWPCRKSPGKSKGKKVVSKSKTKAKAKKSAGKPKVKKGYTAPAEVASVGTAVFAE